MLSNFFSEVKIIIVLRCKANAQQYSRYSQKLLELEFDENHDHRSHFESSYFRMMLKSKCFFSKKKCAEKRYYKFVPTGTSETSNSTNFTFLSYEQR